MKQSTSCFLCNQENDSLRIWDSIGSFRCINLQTAKRQGHGYEKRTGFGRNRNADRLPE